MKHPKLKKIVRWVVAPVVAPFLLASAALTWDGLTDEMGKADVGLVLGTTVYPNGTPSPRLRARLDRAVALHAQSMFSSVIVSGALGREGHDEAVVMRDYLVARGVPASRVIVDSQGVTTMASARNAVAIMRRRGLRSVMAVGQYFHLPRTKLALRRAGAATVYTSHARYFAVRDLYSVPREVVAYAVYATRGRD